MAYSPQGRAITGRRQYSPARTGRPPYYTKYPDEAIQAIPTDREYEYGPSYKSRTLNPDLDSGYYRGINKNDIIAAQEDGYYENIERRRRGEEPLTEMEIHQGYIDKFKIPDDTLSGLRRERSANLPGGDMDISAGLPEGFSDTSGFAPIADMNEAGTQFGQGNYGKGAVSLAKGITGLTPLGIGYNVATSIAKPATTIAKKGYQQYIEPYISPFISKIKGLFSQEAIPTGPPPSLASSGHDDPGTVGMIGSGPGAGLPASIGLPAPGALGPGQSTGMPGIIGGPLSGQGIDLSDIDIGGFDDGGFGDIGDDGGSDLGEGFE